MRLRALIEGKQSPPMSLPTPATVATVATVRGRLGNSRQSVATVATVATLSEPESWPALIRAVTIPGGRWSAAADALDRLLAADVIERALIIGWDVRELVGVWQFEPHDHPHHAGLIYSLRPGDSVASIHDAGCAIVIADTNVQHIWRRTPFTQEVLLPWEAR